MLCQRALLKMPSQLIRALLKMKAGVANTSSAQDAVTANTSPAQDAYPPNTSSAQYKSWRCFQDDQHEGETGSSSWSTSLYIYVCNVFFSFSVYFLDFRFYFGGLWISETLGPGPGAADPLHTQQ